MATINTRNSVLAIKPETTEGTPVAPTGTGDYTALQPDFQISPDREVLTNDEIRASIGIAKPILGNESPTASFSHYLRASGTVATAPDFGEVLKAIFGAEAIASTEYDTVASSTTSLVKVDTGEGASFQRGEGLLIKDPTNGYRIRAIHSIATDDLTPGFQVPVAPGTGVNLGKCVLYYPVNTGHQALTLWHYLGNGGAVQMLAGCRPTSFSFDASAGQLVNANYSFEALSYYLNPIEITASTQYLDFTDDDGTAAAIIPTGWYKDPHQLAQAVEDAMDAVSTETATVTYSDSTGKFTIATTGTVLTLLWNTGANTANTIGTKLGFAVAADDSGTGATTGYTSDNAYSAASPYTGALDSADPVAAKYHEVMFGDADDYACLDASSISFSMNNTRRALSSICAESGVSGSIISARDASLTITALLNQYDADKFRKYREGSTVRFQYSFGVKSAANWVAGSCGYLYLPTATITSFEVSDDDGLASLTMEVQPYVDSDGNGEMYLGFL